jgi:hypothetical protein
VDRARPLGGAAAILFSAVVFASALGASAATKSPACPIHKAAATDAHKPRDFVDCDAIPFLEQFSHVRLKAATRLLRTYLGKWILAQGKIIDIGSASSPGRAREIEFEINDSDGTDIVSAIFGKRWYRQVSGLKNGDRIAVTGQIQDANLMGVEGVPDLALINAEIVDPTSKP